MRKKFTEDKPVRQQIHTTHDLNHFLTPVSERKARSYGGRAAGD